MLEMQRFTQKISARFYAFTLSVLVNKSLEIFILALLERFLFYYPITPCLLYLFLQTPYQGRFELPVSHVAAMGSGSSGSPACEFVPSSHHLMTKAADVPPSRQWPLLAASA